MTLDEPRESSGHFVTIQPVLLVAPAPLEVLAHTSSNSGSNERYMTMNPQTSVSEAIAIAIKDILAILVNDAKHFPEFAASFLRTVVAPGAVLVFGLVVLVQSSKKMYRLLNPPSAKEVYLEALNLYNNKSSSSRSKVRRAEQLLWEAIRRDPDWKPAKVSLVALYIYRLEQPQAALRLLDDFERTTANNRPPERSGDDDPDFAALRQDAKAMLESNHHMVHKLFGEDEYLSLRTAAVSSQ
jgi:hypothetical protein